MIAKWFALALCATACGSVADRPPAVDGAVDGPPADAAADATPPKMYRGTFAETPAVGFGGLPYCRYTITLKQLSIELEILPGGPVTAGRAQALNVETVVVSANPNCPASTPVIPPNIATYMFQSAKPMPGGMQLTFRGAGTNNPGVNLVVDLAPAGTGFQARLAFHRFDQPAPLDWSVVTTLSMSVQ